MKYEVQGYDNGKRKLKLQAMKALTLENAFDGWRFDAIELSTTINNTKDIDNLVELLQKTRLCFVR